MLDKAKNCICKKCGLTVVILAAPDIILLDFPKFIKEGDIVSLPPDDVQEIKNYRDLHPGKVSEQVNGHLAKHEKECKGNGKPKTK